MTLSFLAKFSLFVSNQLASQPLSDRDLSALKDIERGISSGSQVFQEGNGPIVGKSIVHTSAMKQVTGEAIYVDDIPKLANELYAVIVPSTEAHAFIKNVDPSQALSMPGVVDYVYWKDIPNFNIDMSLDNPHNPNVIGPVFKGITFLNRRRGIVCYKRSTFCWPNDWIDYR